MSESDYEKLGQAPGMQGPKSTDPKKVIRQNLNNFLNPAFPPVPSKAPDPNGALRLRMAQMELAHKMRLNQGETSKTQSSYSKPVPMHFSPPPGGFGSAQGLYHLKQGDMGKPGPAKKKSACKPSPYQQIFANASQPTKTEKTEIGEADLTSDHIIQVPLEAEFRQNEKPTKLKGKRFRNPSL